MLKQSLSGKNEAIRIEQSLGGSGGGVEGTPGAAAVMRKKKMGI